MTASLSSIRTTQHTVHPKLLPLLWRRRCADFQRSLPDFSEKVIQELKLLLQERKPQFLILDSGCGTGYSTKVLAQRFPFATVIGIDKSIKKLSKATRTSPVPSNCFLFRAELVDIWRWLHQIHLSIDYHFLLFPNPWPKPRHFRKRIYAHPVFPKIFAFSRYIELRTNWKVLAEEFAVVAASVTGKDAILSQYSPAAYLTPFEKKYAERGEPLYKVQWVA